MKPRLPADDKLNDTVGAPERGYAKWKREKIERGLDQSKDRGAMIPAEQVLRLRQPRSDELTLFCR